MDSKTLILLLISGGTFVLIGASVGGNYWVDTAVNNSGLWKYCNDVFGCGKVEFEGVASYIHATRAFGVMSVLAAGFGALISLVRLFKEMDGKIVTGLFLGAGVCMVIALSIYTSKNIDVISNFTAIDWGWSYILGWISAILAFVCAILAAVLK